ncbi:MAG: four helix bundle protein [Polyangiaceae bacterium]|nr:four helix bundle protein [Polyangiaceae bacterium]
MLRIYVEFLGVLRGMRPVIEKIERRDSDLARQLRRAAASVALNMSEGSGSEGGTRRQRYLSALGSARETLSCLEVADAFGYAELGAGSAAVAGLNRVIGGLVRLVGR